MWSLITHRFCLALVLIAGIATNVEAGEYPNSNTEFDFVPLDASKEIGELAASSKWWETASFYQIYPRSFKDSDGDGVGDLKGITEQLDYLKEIGIAATWLSPIFKSPMADFGYDIANYTEIDPIFGTMADFDSLIEKGKEIGVKIIVDFVPNHSSDECEWFKKSAARDPDYHDFYVWHPGKMVNGTRHPPTNWISVFRGSAWQWHDGRQEYYLHQFLKKQPDLNYRSPRVRETMKEVLRFWLRKGVAGFRVDAVPFIFEVEPDKDGNWPDEPRNSWVNDPDDYGYLNHIYTANQPATIEMVYEWRRVLDEFKENSDDDRILMTEAYSPIEVVMQYYGNATAEGAQVPFNFLLISWVTNDSDAYHYAETVNTWLKNMPKGRTPNWVIGNHDQNRVGSRLGEDRISIMNMLIMTLPGCSITYNGEEIGMTDVWISWNDTVDPSACNSNPSVYEKLSRDPERTPFQWSDDVNAGFSTAKKTWLPVSENYKRVNVKLERDDLRSVLNTYKHLHELRQEATMRYGATEVKALSRAVLAVKRTLLNERTYITLLNIFDAEEVIDLRQAFADIPNSMEYVVVSDRSAAKRGDIVESASVRLQPKEATVLGSTAKSWYFAYYE